MQPEDARSELAQQWLEFAGQDREAAERASQPPSLPTIVAFHCQQAMEKALKGYLFWNNTPFPKTHLLVELVQRCVELDGDFLDLLPAAEVLTPYAVISRYPDDLVAVSDQDAEQARELADSAVSFVRSRLPADLMS